MESPMLEKTREKRVERDVPISEWPDWLRRDFEENQLNPCVGGMLVSEGPRARVWHIRLKPGERLPFHRHVLDYFWTCTEAGRSRSYYPDGRVVEIDNEVGDTAHLTFGPGEHLLHNLENIGDTELGFVTVELLPSANAPLPVPEEARAKDAA
jgi:beta-alanine degradation protein BauB